MQISDLIKKVKPYLKSKDISLIKRTYNYAEKAHEGQKRASGEKYIEHPLCTSFRLADLELDAETISAGLLHDVIEDTEVTKSDLEKEFGKNIANMVEGVTNITLLKNMSKEERHAESIRKVILASIKDIRVILIKLADRAHNMSTIDVFREEKRRRIASDALDIYAPIAHKLGIAKIKWELEENAFRQLNPQAYLEIQKKLKLGQKYREKEVDKIKQILDKEIKISKIPYRIFGRPKHIYSINKKMKIKNLSFEDIYDLRAIRIITKEVRHCYEILGIIHNLWTPIPREFDDYIANPKSNGYQSLHTIVIGPTRRPVEIQIRTEDMNKVAEVGIAAHWKYKGVKSDQDFDKKLNWMMQVDEWQKESKDAKEFMNLLHIDFFEDEIFTFTPRGRVIELPKGATILDFAFSVHTELGSKCIAAKVNGHFVPLRWKLSNGDLVEIITSKTQKPSRDWLKIVHTSKAKTKIKQHIRATQNIPVKSYSKAEDVKKELEAWIIDVDNMVKPEIKLSKCCRPIPGDDIVGYATKTLKVSIHKTNCAYLKGLKGLGRRKKVNVRWMDNLESIVEIKVDALERIGLVAEILNNLLAINTPIKSAHAKPLGKEMTECSFSMETGSIEHLQHVIKRIKNIEGVKHVYIGNLSK